MADIHEFPDIPGYLSIKQAAQMLGITDKRVYRYIEIGRLPAFKASGVFLLAEEDVKQFKLNPLDVFAQVPHVGACTAAGVRFLPQKFRCTFGKASRLNCWRR
jgi:excisionase family DNA binding protein